MRGRALLERADLRAVLAEVAGSREYYRRAGGTHGAFVATLERDLLYRDPAPAAPTASADATVFAEAAPRRRYVADLIDGREFRVAHAQGQFRRINGAVPDADELRHLLGLLRRSDGYSRLMAAVLGTDSARERIVRRVREREAPAPKPAVRVLPAVPTRVLPGPAADAPINPPLPAYRDYQGLNIKRVPWSLPGWGPLDNLAAPQLKINVEGCTLDATVRDDWGITLNRSDSVGVTIFPAGDARPEDFGIRVLDPHGNQLHFFLGGQGASPLSSRGCIRSG